MLSFVHLEHNFNINFKEKESLAFVLKFIRTIIKKES